MAEGAGARRERTVRGASPSGRPYLSKAQRSLGAAQLELASGYYDGAVNRAYYACYQAAVAALVTEGVPPVVERYWPHDVVQVKFPALLVDGTGRYPRTVRGTLKVLFDERLKADYEPDGVNATTASEAVRRAGVFVDLVRERVGQE